MELSTIQGFEVVNDKNYYLARTYNKALRIYSLLSCKMFYDEKIRTSGGFIDAIFLAAVMIVCFMWGMLVVILG